MPSPSRRELLAALPTIAFATATNARGGQETSAGKHVLRLGLTTYSTRALTLEGTIEAACRLGVGYVSIKDFHLPLDSTPEQRRATATKLRAAGLTVLGCGVIAIDTDAEKTRARFEYARDLGTPTIIASPDPAALNTVEQLAREFDIRVAIHNHGPDDRWYRTPKVAADLIASRDRRLGLCIDTGHAARAGIDPAVAIRTHADRLIDIHLKDLDRVAADARSVEVGRGALDIPAVLRALQDVTFAGHVALEYEKDEKDPLPGMAESIGFVRGVLHML